MNHIAVLTSGGDAPGMNAAIRAVVRTGCALGMTVTGVERGYRGLIESAFLDMTARSVSGILNRGGTILRSARCRAFMEPEGRTEAAANLKKRGVEGLVVIGGDGTYRGAEKLHAEHGFAVIGLPGTIDNDIGGTDYTIGFDTALNTALEAIDRIRDTADSHDRIFFIEVMGRNNGYLAMYSGIAGGAEEILTPETVTDLDGMIERFRAAKKRGKNTNIVIVAEGDEEGNAKEISEKIIARSEFRDIRVAIIGHLQRGGAPTAFDRLLATRMGVRAVEALRAGETGKMVGIRGKDLVLCPFTDAWETPSRFDDSYVKIAQILAT